ncbi:mini-chromosome maintenance complex-binding protein [Nicotiana sylvestris]|uniref:Mini-chromosome maintenance complex-binding protein n=1 Tax=Nicotiana sylvestris TaxID=4096 RepID=A0A1U7YIZ4_NICSY|nr:PREDICTED: mini-chromosome maintenance complex-binding protein [Nicotiana sylvestris]
MVGLPYDCLTNPLGAVRLTFEKAVASGSDPATFDGKDWGATDLFSQFLFDDGGLSKVPFLNPSTMTWVQPNTLVRFRGMIQDMLGNEFYVGAYKEGETWRTNKFADLSQFPMATGSSPDMRVWERRLLYCVPVPGQNSWIEPSSGALLNPCAISSSPQREKRQRDNDLAMDDVDMQVTDEEVHDSTSNKKMREDGIASGSSNSGSTPTEGVGSATSVLPNFDTTSFPCLVKIYDSPDSDLKLNDVFEFIGVFTFDPEFPVDKNDNKDLESSFCDDTLVQMPPSKVPRLHCLVHRKLTAQDFISGPLTFELKSQLVKGIREALVGHLTTVLGNDGVAANFMLLHLLSKVHARADSIAVGKLSLNLTCFTKETLSIFGHRLNFALKNLLPFTHYVPLTVDYLNKVSLAPRKDYQTNRLVSGILQLAEGSHLTIDETQLQAGTLNSTGVDNARVLKSLLELQKVEYDFTYYKMDIPADTQLLVLSEGKSNILPADLVLPFRPLSLDAAQDVETEVLRSWRWYLATMRSLSHSIEQEMQKVVEDDLVAARQADRSLSSQDFSRLLTMGRLISLSFGETSLTLEHWQMAKELERLRKERLQGSS